MSGEGGGGHFESFFLPILIFPWVRSWLVTHLHDTHRVSENILIAKETLKILLRVTTAP